MKDSTWITNLKDWVIDHLIRSDAKDWWQYKQGEKIETLKKSSAYRQRQQLQRHSIFLDFHLGCPLDMKDFLFNFFGAFLRLRFYNPGWGNYFRMRWTNEVLLFLPGLKETRSTTLDLQRFPYIVTWPVMGLTDAEEEDGRWSWRSMAQRY